eukprot:TRINITY_DN103774_c0_g1_i1.p1 TRINITY_DN103774_c0_g1~~TRINITY_DN103774_c0_g1_i1.p1  ORF type:complete len:300 (+),score=45.82 TRINITY_DN103774_c0_g1_i1:213-1112(+)
MFKKGARAPGSSGVPSSRGADGARHSTMLASEEAKPSPATSFPGHRLPGRQIEHGQNGAKLVIDTQGETKGAQRRMTPEPESRSARMCVDDSKDEFASMLLMRMERYVGELESAAGKAKATKRKEYQEKSEDGQKRLSQGCPTSFPAVADPSSTERVPLQRLQAKLRKNNGLLVAAGEVLDVQAKSGEKRERMDRCEREQEREGRSDRTERADAKDRPDASRQDKQEMQEEERSSSLQSTSNQKSRPMKPQYGNMLLSMVASGSVTQRRRGESCRDALSSLDRKLLASSTPKAGAGNRR